MGLLSEVWKVSPWHIQWGGAGRNAFLYGVVYLHITSGRGGAYNLTELCVACVCVRICACGVKVDNYPDFTRLHVISSLYSRQSPFDRTGVTTFGCACVGMCAHVSMRL